jgi:hypothetical protein
LTLDIHRKWLLGASVFWIVALTLATASLLSWARPYHVNRNTTIFAVAAGSWAWTTSDAVTTYDVLLHTASGLRGAIRGERRLTATGAPVVWDLELRGPNRYDWHRADWAFYERTAEIQRCGVQYRPAPFSGATVGPPS